MKDTLLTDETMELIAKLYSYMDEEEMASWSMEAAQEMVADQYRYGRTLHRRSRPALQQRQLPDRLVVLSRQLSNQELPPAGGFSCCGEFGPRWRVSGFQIKGGKGFGLGGAGRTWGQCRRDVGNGGRALHDEKSAGQIA